MSDQSAWLRCLVSLSVLRNLLLSQPVVYAAEEERRAPRLQSVRSTSTTVISRALAHTAEVALGRCFPGDPSSRERTRCEDDPRPTQRPDASFACPPDLSVQRSSSPLRAFTGTMPLVMISRGLLRGQTSRASLDQELVPAFAGPSAPQQRLLMAEVGYPDLGNPDTFCRRCAAWVSNEPRGPSLPAGSWRSLLSPTCAACRCAHPPAVRPLARATPPSPLLSQAAQQGCFPWCSAKSIAFGTPKVPSIVGRVPPGGDSARVNELSYRDPGEGGDCPHVVPNLWRTRRRLFNPCRLGTF